MVVELYILKSYQMQMVKVGAFIISMAIKY